MPARPTRATRAVACEDTPAIVTAPPPPRLIPRSDYDVSVWVEVILGKYRYAQPTHRYLQDLGDQGLPVSPGTVAGGLQALAPLFEPIVEALYCRQMSEQLFHNDETRWEVFVEIEGKVGTRWYLWVTRSPSVVFYCIDPSRSAAVPVRTLPACSMIRSLSSVIATALTKSSPGWRIISCSPFAGRMCAATSWMPAAALPSSGAWALQWKERIGALYHLNGLRLQHWDRERPLAEQSEAFKQHHEALKQALQLMHDEATRIVAPDTAGAQAGDSADRKGRRARLKRNYQRARKRNRKRCCRVCSIIGRVSRCLSSTPKSPWTTTPPRTRSVIRSPGAKTTMARAASGVPSWPPRSSLSCRLWGFGASTHAIG